LHTMQRNDTPVTLDDVVALNIAAPTSSAMQALQRTGNEGNDS
jgi:hypothetical protein